MLPLWLRPPDLELGDLDLDFEGLGVRERFELPRDLERRRGVDGFSLVERRIERLLDRDLCLDRDFRDLRADVDRDRLDEADEGVGLEYLDRERREPFRLECLGAGDLDRDLELDVDSPLA